MIKYIIYFFQAIRLFDRPMVTRPRNNRTIRKGQPRPSEDVRHIGGQTFRLSGNPDNPDWENITGELSTSGRTTSLTVQDTEQIALHRLNADKYAAIKFQWGSGKSITEIVYSLRNQKGCGKRTVQTYVAAINRGVVSTATPSPTAKKQNSRNY